MKIHNDHLVLEKHITTLRDLHEQMLKTSLAMEKKIADLNDKGFQDGNFENLYSVFIGNVENIKLVQKKLLAFEQHACGLSQIIKDYCDVEV